MNSILRNALRNNIGLRHQLEKNLLGDKGEIWEKELKKFLRQEECWVVEKAKKAADRYSITVDYSLTLDQMIAVGEYDYANPDINSKHLPVKGEGKLELKLQLIHFDRNISSDDAERELDKLGLRPANLEELLAFGAQYPDLQKQFPIVALKAVASVHGGRDVACLDFVGSERRLDLYWRGRGWLARCRFLALPK